MLPKYSPTSSLTKKWPGCVEPKNPSGEKTPLNQEKINLLKSKFAHNTCNYMGKYVHGEKYNLHVVWKNLDSFLLIIQNV